LRKTAELQPDVVLLDLSIPVLSGVATAKILQNDYPAACIVFMSAQEPDVLARIAASARVPYSISKQAIGKDLSPLLTVISAEKGFSTQSAA
jgi:DNA-binding NarL/FixJ family response regulator